MVKDRIVRLTPAGKARLTDELHHLTTVKKPALARRIQDASDHGDISDNSEYEEIKESYVLIDARIRELEQTLDRAEIIETHSEGGVIGLGSVVTLRGDDGDEETWTLVSPEEANTLDGAISTDSPVGHAVMGCRVGDSTIVKTPGGEIVFQVLNVD